MSSNSYNVETMAPQHHHQLQKRNFNGKNRVIKWDEEVIAEHDKERGSRQKIDEAPTPFRYSSESDQSEGESGSEKDISSASSSDSNHKKKKSISFLTNAEEFPFPSDSYSDFSSSAFNNNGNAMMISDPNPVNVMHEWSALQAKLNYEQFLQESNDNLHHQTQIGTAWNFPSSNVHTKFPNSPPRFSSHVAPQTTGTGHSISPDCDTADMMSTDENEESTPKSITVHKLPTNSSSIPNTTFRRIGSGHQNSSCHPITSPIKSSSNTSSSASPSTIEKEEFNNRRAAHYNEYLVLQASRKKMQQEEDEEEDERERQQANADRLYNQSNSDNDESKLVGPDLNHGY